MLLLAELVGLVVLERHQLFEPVHDAVGDKGDKSDIRATLGLITERMGASGQATVCASAPEVFRALTRVAREALARDHEAPRILRLARLSGRLARVAQEDPDLTAEWRDWTSALSSYYLTPGSPSDARTRHWSVRVILSMTTLEMFDAVREQFLQLFMGAITSSVEMKILLRPQIEAMLSPALITDRDVVMVFDDGFSAFRWGVSFQGRQYTALFERWFDDLWSSVPESYLIYSRNG